MMSGTSQIHCCHTPTARIVCCSPLLVTRARLFRAVHENRSSLSTVCLAKGQSYHVEVEVTEDEDPEGVYKRFRNSCNLSGMVHEARRRKFFENPQDIKKRKQQEKGLRKMRAVRERFLQTYEDAHQDVPPFTDLFAEDEDIYDVLGDGSFDEESRPKFPGNANWSPGQANGNNEERKQEGRANGHRSSENISMRSVPSQGPRLQSGESNEGTAKANGKNKPQVKTARSRRAARQKAARK